MEWIKNIYIVITGFLSVYALVWALPGTLISMTISFGNMRHIVFIDQLLSKDTERLQEQLTMHKLGLYAETHVEIGFKLFVYWLTYPFIYRRAANASMKFKVFMWLNSLGMWSWILAPLLGLIMKSARIL